MVAWTIWTDWTIWMLSRQKRVQESVAATGGTPRDFAVATQAPHSKWGVGPPPSGYSSQSAPTPAQMPLVGPGEPDPTTQCQAAIEAKPPTIAP
jgi:hypothetical protein